MIPGGSSIVWTVSTQRYYDWSDDERRRVEEFVDAHGIDHTLRNERGVERCPTCPACAKSEAVTVPLNAGLPDVPGAWRETPSSIPDPSAEGGNHG